MTAKRAAVRPRFVSPATGDALTLEDSVLDAVRHFGQGVIEIAGPPGSGKTLALSHLQAVLPRELDIEYFSSGTDNSGIARHECSVVEVAGSDSLYASRIVRFDLAPWGSDEVIEYCLVRYAELCPSLVNRVISARDLSLLGGNAELYSLVIDRFAEDPGLRTAVAALQQEILDSINNDMRRLSEFGLLSRRNPSTTQTGRYAVLLERLRQLLRHRPIRTTATAMVLAEAVNRGDVGTLHDARISRVVELWDGIIEVLPCMINAGGRDILRQALTKKSLSHIHPLLGTVLSQCDPDWRPRPSHRPNLCGARLRLVRWSRIDLRHNELRDIDLTGAELEKSLLIGARAEGACFSGACMRDVVLRDIHARRAEFRCCDLHGADCENGDFCEGDFNGCCADDAVFDAANLSASNLNGASMRDTSLRKSQLSGAILNDTDLTGADLTRAVVSQVDLRSTVLTQTNMEKAVFRESVFEDVRIVDARCPDAIFTNAVMTSSVMPNADFRGAILDGAYLADVQWPGADLRGASLVGATFHMGSSRSGMVASDLASEGTRTGFYTDDYGDHTFKSPEEIRTADLSGCDLRDANIDGVDFWRVDLRRARISADQLKQLIETGAILD